MATSPRITSYNVCYTKLLRAISLREGAIAPWSTRTGFYYFQILEALSDHYDFDIRTPFQQLPEKLQRIILRGSGSEQVKFFYDHGGQRVFYHKPFEA